MVNLFDKYKQMLGGVTNYFDANKAGSGANFWNTDAAQGLAKAQKVTQPILKPIVKATPVGMYQQAKPLIESFRAQPEKYITAGMPTLVQKPAQALLKSFSPNPQRIKTETQNVLSQQLGKPTNRISPERGNELLTSAMGGEGYSGGLSGEEANVYYKLLKPKSSDIASTLFGGMAGLKTASILPSIGKTAATLKTSAVYDNAAEVYEMAMRLKPAVANLEKLSVEERLPVLTKLRNLLVKDSDLMTYEQYLLKNTKEDYLKMIDKVTDIYGKIIDKEVSKMLSRGTQYVKGEGGRFAGSVGLENRQIGQATKEVGGGLDALKAEARKYKSAEEFIYSIKEKYQSGNNLRFFERMEGSFGKPAGKITGEDLTNLYNQSKLPEVGGVNKLSSIGTAEQTARKLPLLGEKATTGIDQIESKLKGLVGGGGSRLNVPEVPSSTESIGAVDKIINALNSTKKLGGAQKQLYSKERAQRVGMAESMAQKVSGEAGYYAQLSQLKGALPKVEFESLRGQVTQQDIDSLFQQVNSSSTLSRFEKITASGGLAKLLGKEGGYLPTEGEIKLLSEVFPPEFTQAILNNRSLMQKIMSVGGEIINLQRAVMATADLSAPLRQGVFLIGRPKQWLPAFGDMFKYAFSQKAYDNLLNEVQARPTYPLMRESKLALTDMSKFMTSREEAFMSNLVERIPGFGQVAKGSNRAYSGFLNKLRADVFDDMVRSVKTAGIAEERPGVYDDIAKFVNSATGRGDLGALNNAAVALNGLFFSPRLMASRINLINPTYYMGLDPYVRKEALKSLVTFGGAVTAALSLAKLGGADVGTDPRSADFGKIKIGDTRYDIMGGFQQYMVLASRLATGEMISSTTGKEIQLGEGYKPTTRMDIITRFLQSKEAPVASLITDVLRGQTSMGEPVKIPVEIIDRFIPMLAQDLYDLYREKGPVGAAMAVPGAFGVGMQTYSDQIPMKTKTPAGKETLKWRSKPSLGEDILNKVTNTEVSNVPKEMWKPLAEERSAETQRKIELEKVKARVLETGKEEISGDTKVYLDNGVVKSKKISTESRTPQTKTYLENPQKSTQVPLPEVTGNTEVDKENRHQFYLEVGRRAKEVKLLNEAGKVSDEEAEKLLEELTKLKESVSGKKSSTSTTIQKSSNAKIKATAVKVKATKAKKVKKVTVKKPIAKVKAPKATPLKIVKPKKATTYKLAKVTTSKKRNSLKTRIKRKKVKLT